MSINTGHIFQKEESDGIPEESDAGEVEGRGSTEDAWSDWDATAWTVISRGEGTLECKDIVSMFV